MATFANPFFRFFRAIILFLVPSMLNLDRDSVEDMLFYVVNSLLFAYVVFTDLFGFAVKGNLIR